MRCHLTIDETAEGWSVLAGVRVGLMHSWGENRLMQSLRTTVKRFLRELEIDLSYGEVVQLLDVCLKETGTLPQRMSAPPFAMILVKHKGIYESFLGGASGKESACRCRRLQRHGFHPWVGNIPWRRKWQPTPVFLPGKSHGQRSLAGYSPWGCKESDTTEHTHTTPRVLFEKKWVRQRKTNTICSHLYVESKKKTKLIFKKYIYATSNKDLLYSTGNYSQYLVITYNGK